jgi:hypothetical protein
VIEREKLGYLRQYRYGLKGRASILAGVEEFSLLHSIQTDSGYLGFFPPRIKQPGHEAITQLCLMPVKNIGAVLPAHLLSTGTLITDVPTCVCSLAVTD